MFDSLKRCQYLFKTETTCKFYNSVASWNKVKFWVGELKKNEPDCQEKYKNKTIDSKQPRFIEFLTTNVAYCQGKVYFMLY